MIFPEHHRGRLVQRVVRRLVHGERKMNETKVLRILHRIPDCFRVSLTGASDRVGNPCDQIVCVRNIPGFGRRGAVLLLVTGKKVEHLRIAEVHAVDPVAPLHRVAGDLVHTRAEAVASDKNRLPVEFRRLLHNQAHLFVENGERDRLGAGRFHLRQLGPEVDVAAAETPNTLHFAAEFFNACEEKLLKPFGVVASNVGDNGRAFDAELVDEVVGHDLSLVGVGVAETERVGAHCVCLRIDGDCGVGARGTYLRDFAAVHNGGYGDIEAAVVRPPDRNDFVFVNQTAGRLDSVLLSSADVVIDQFERPSKNAARLVQLFDREQRAVAFMLASSGAVSGERRQIPDLDRISRRCCRRRSGSEKQYQREDDAKNATVHSSQEFLNLPDMC